MCVYIEILVPYNIDKTILLSYWSVNFISKLFSEWENGRENIGAYCIHLEIQHKRQSKMNILALLFILILSSGKCGYKVGK